ncbi:glycosyltransferase [Lentibacillus cibarius]|uniref:Glycosyltransferase n=1 Tax=Lentibacillus cibarius TaxID=2583219 RepID=A0A549YFH0_9BACI|nr:glycosyltransferase [Lentibacillus cibarius]TRM10632.1 glycosyltransferase [Lentibacillus cibarius]
MAIGIVGNYGNNNQGDEAILEGILLQLEATHHVSRDEMIVFSNQPEQTAAKYGVQSVKLYYKNKSSLTTMLGTMRKNRSIIRKLDLLLIGGGGIFMDLYGREAFLFGMYGWLAKLSGTPVVLYGVGAGPILTKIGKTILRSLAHLAKLVTVRDPKSKKLLESIGVKSAIHVIGDPAFQVRQPAETKRNTNGLQIGVTAVPYHHRSYWPEEDMAKYDDYITGMARNLDTLLAEHPDATVNFFATKYPQDLQVAEAIRDKMAYSGRSTMQEKSMNHQEITQYASEQDLVIGTRLHSLILALVSHIPVIAVSYHHKVQDFMDMVGCGEYTVPISDLNADDAFFAQAYRSMNRDWPATLDRFQAVATKMKQMSDRGMGLIRQTFENNKEKLLVLSNMYPSGRSKTFGIFVKNQVELLRSKGLDVDVLAIDDPRKGKLLLAKKYGSFLLQSMLNLLTQGKHYHTVHAHYIFPTGLVGLLYKKLLGKRLVVTSHGGDIDQMSKKSERVQSWTKKILEEADEIIVVGERLRAEMLAAFSIDAGKISVINMGVNRSVFHEQDKMDARRRLDLPADEKVLLFVGNLIRAKGLDDLVDAYDIVRDRHDDVSLHLIGEAKDASYFANLKQQAKKRAGIHIHDAMPQEQVADWMAAADVFVLPSHIEGFGLVALEAMACRLPVVGTDVGGLSYLLANDAGMLAAPHDSDDLAAKIDDVLADERTRSRLIANGLEKAAANDQEKLIQDVIALYGLSKEGSRS